MIEGIFFLIALGASVAGAICGIGGGIIIKPLLDITGLTTTAQAGFLSGCTVLAMSAVSLYRRLKGNPGSIQYKTMSIVAVGAVIGGIAGKSLFDLLKNAVGDASAKQLQAIFLLVLTAGTFMYTLFENRIQKKKIQSKTLTFGVALVLGGVSSFLGLGGGPFNLIVLSYLFSMETKEAGLNSIFIIIFSQTASLLQTVVGGSIPAVNPLSLGLMIIGGIAGGIIGSSLNKKMTDKQVRIVLLVLMVLIMGTCVANII